MRTVIPRPPLPLRLDSCWFLGVSETLSLWIPNLFRERGIQKKGKKRGRKRGQKKEERATTGWRSLDDESGGARSREKNTAREALEGARKPRISRTRVFSLSGLFTSPLLSPVARSVPISLCTLPKTEKGPRPLWRSTLCMFVFQSLFLFAF